MYKVKVAINVALWVVHDPSLWFLVSGFWFLVSGPCVSAASGVHVPISRLRETGLPYKIRGGGLGIDSFRP